MGLELSTDSLLVLIAFLLYLVGVGLLGYFSHRYLTRGEFVKEYFLGNRGLGPWVLALTIAATGISGGTFMGFPSLIYTNGWIMALWIASYMVVPLTIMALMGKRINQMSRLCGSVTVPDVLRDRFHSPALGLVSSLLILGFLTVNLVAQFKAGGNVLEEALRLPAARGQFVRAEVDARNQSLALHFKLEDGRQVVQRTAIPTGGRFLSEKVQLHPDTAEAPTHLHVFFATQGGEVGRLINYPAQQVDLPLTRRPINKGYLIGLIIFALTVVAYTTYGGFWAVTLTDVLEGLVMLAGIIIMAILAVNAVEPVTVGDQELHGLAAANERLRQMDPALVYGPGPKNYMPLGLAFSFFLMWSCMSAGQPSGMVRLMSFKDSASLRRAMALICLYFMITYFCLMVIFICARAIYPTQYLHEAGSEALGEPDRIMPAMARYLASPLVAGLLLAAPYAAIMSTVAAFLLMISSSLVRDLYQRCLNPNVSTRTIKISSYLITMLVGVVVMIGALNPPAFLQYVIVFTGTGLGCSFLVPMLLTLYWKRATAKGVLASMLGGLLTVVVLYALGWIDSGSQAAVRDYQAAVREADEKKLPPPATPQRAMWLEENLRWIPGWGEPRPDPFNPIFLFGCDSVVWGLLASLLLGVSVSLMTQPDSERVKKFFP